MNFGAFTTISREVIVTFTDGTTQSYNTALSFKELKSLIQHKKVESIHNRNF